MCCVWRSRKRTNRSKIFSFCFCHCLFFVDRSFLLSSILFFLLSLELAKFFGWSDTIELTCRDLFSNSFTAYIYILYISSLINGIWPSFTPVLPVLFFPTTNYVSTTTSVSLQVNRIELLESFSFLPFFCNKNDMLKRIFPRNVDFLLAKSYRTVCTENVTVEMKI